MFKKLIAVFFAFLAAAGFANAQEYPDTLRLTRADGMQIELEHRTANMTGKAFYLYNEIGYSNPNNKAQSMSAAAVILGLGNSTFITENNRSRIMTEPSTGRNYVVSLPTMPELRTLHSVTGLLPEEWRGNLDGGPKFWTSSQPLQGIHKTLNLANGQEDNHWDIDNRVLALIVQETVSDYRTCFYEHTNYEGKSKCYGNGNYTDLDFYPNSRGGEGYAPRTFSSAKVGANCSSVNIREGASTSSFGTTFTQDKPDFFSRSMNDKATAVTVTCSEVLPPIQNQDVLNQDPYSVCFFEHANYQGRSKCYTNGFYQTVGNYADGTSANDTFSSFSIGASCPFQQSSFYPYTNYSGAPYRTTPTGDASNPTRRNPFLDGFNDRISSITFVCPRP